LVAGKDNLLAGIGTGWLGCFGDLRRLFVERTMLFHSPRPDCFVLCVNEWPSLVKMGHFDCLLACLLRGHNCLAEWRSMVGGGLLPLTTSCLPVC